MLSKHTHAKGLYGFDLDLPEGDTIIVDKASKLTLFEVMLKEVRLHLIPIPKKNSKLPLNSVKKVNDDCAASSLKHKAVYLIEGKLQKTIHTLTKKGFELKIIFLFSFSASIVC